MQHSLNEVIQLLTSNTVPVCVCAGCPLALRYLQTLAQSGLPQPFSSIQPRIQLPKSLQSMLHTSSRPRWPFILQIPNWNQLKTTWAGQSQSWEAFLLSGFFCLGSSRWKFLLLASSSNFKCIPSRSEIFSAEHKNHVHTLSSETSRFLAKGSKSAVYTYILCYFHFTTPHYAAKYCVLLSKKNIDNIKIILPIPVNLSWLRCQISGFYFH